MCVYISDIYNENKMKRNCNLELRLVQTPSVFSDSSAHERSYQFSNMLSMEGDQSPNQKQQQQLTVFYNGRVAACDVTELQARAIILLASGEMEDEKRRAIPTSGLSMKRSLQRFLEKRKTRLQCTSPYPITTLHK